MRYQFLETKLIRGQEIAYVLDTQDGVVYRSRVEDFVQSEEDEYYESLPVQKKKIPTLKRVLKQSVEDTIEDEPVDIPVKPKPAMIPPALRGVFLPEGTPGSAVETRRV